MSSSSSQEQFAHLKIPLKDIVLATSNFSDANHIRGDEFGKAYKGQLWWSSQLMNIAARRFTGREYWQGNKEFWTEVTILSKLQHKSEHKNEEKNEQKNEHKNLVSFVGFCDEDGEKIVISKLESRGSLYEYVRDPALSWIQRLQICVGVAEALSYIYYDKLHDLSVIHRDIKSSKILLDDQWEAKLSGFELSVSQTTARRNDMFIDIACGTLGYCDPTYGQSGTVTHKSDMYSFGTLLFEVLCGKKVIMVKGNTKTYLASLAISHYTSGRLEDLIDPVLWKQMHTKSFEIFSKTAYCCLKEQRPQRPNINQILVNLKQALVSQQQHENSLISKSTTTKIMKLISDSTTSEILKGKDLEYLKIPLIDIEVATENFAKTYLIGVGGFGEVYKAELDIFDSEKFMQLEDKSTSELPKKRSIVAIKRIMIREDKLGEKGFLAEIEMLTSCKHPNIVSLHGFCDEGGHMILVYEHASKGTLNDYFVSVGSLVNLSWVQRIKICIGIARGLDYLHTKVKRKIIHRDIKSENILLNEDWQAKIADFGLSKFRPENQIVNNTLYASKIAGTGPYLDPEYLKTCKLKNESDIYSFGVVLFEIMCGRFAYDAIYTDENRIGIAHVARRCFNEGTIMKMVDPRLMEETHGSIFTQNKGFNPESLKAFANIAYRCVAESQAGRPTAKDIIKKLEETLSSEENIKDQFVLSAKDIILATQNFSKNNLIGEGGSSKVYKGEVAHVNGRSTIAAKRLNRKNGQGDKEYFLTELQILLEYKHPNIIGLVGYSTEMDERIIVYEYACRGSLDFHLRNNDLRWTKRIQICIDIARGLEFLQGGAVEQDVVIHRDIKSANILLDGDWKAKITDFGLSVVSPLYKDMDFVIDDACGTIGYVDPLYIEKGFLTKESDIYSFGVVLFEILCGSFAIVDWDTDKPQRLSKLIRYNFSIGKLDEMVFEGIKGQIALKSFITFVTIAYQCIQLAREERPKIGDVVLQLKQALEFQEDYDIWKPKLPKDYEYLIQMSNSLELHSAEKNKDLYDLFSKGILLKEGKVLFILGGHGERNEMISAIKFSYKQRRLQKWRSIPESRFRKVAKMLDISNLKIQIKIKPQFLSPGVDYGVHLVFKFCEPRISVAKRMYVNLKYKMGREILHSYFATWREDGWMMIELYRFSNHKKDIDFDFLLEGFSRGYCESHEIYIEGVEFRAIENVSHEESKDLKEVQHVEKSNLNIHQVQELPANFGKLLSRFENHGKSEEFSQNRMNKKKSFMISAKEALYPISDVTLFNSTLSTHSRSQDAIELLSQQVFCIKCKIESQRLSRNTQYACYLVFKLSEKCGGLHCPVIVRDLLQRKNKGKGILYFRSPSSCNVHDTNHIPKEREDGWMEVNVWQFSLNYDLPKDYIPVSLKLITYEGTMCGLIVNGLEFRPISGDI